MNALKAKATDLVVESLKLIVTISTLFFGALLAYGSNVTSAGSKLSYYIGLTAFTICAVLCIMNIHSLINKLYREEDDAIKQGEAKTLNVLATLALVAGLISSAVFITKNPVRTDSVSPSPTTTLIRDDQIAVGSETKVSVRITKNAQGKIEEVLIGEK